LRITNNGDDNHSFSMSFAQFKVLKAAVAIEFEIIGDMIVDSEVNITFTVPEDIDGNLTVIVDGEEFVGYIIEDGKIIISDTYAAGPHTVILAITDDSNYNDAVIAETVDIAKLIPVVNARDLSFVVDNEGILEITGPAYGNLIVYIDDIDYILVIDESGNATLDVSDLHVGTYTVEITYIEDDMYSKAIFENAATITVNPKDEITINVDDVEINVGDIAVIKASLPYGVAGETVIINVDEIGLKVADIDANGTAVAEFSDLAAGTYEILVIYGGDDAWYGGYANATLTVSKVYPEISVNVADAVVCNDVTVTVTLPGDAKGFVYFTVDNKNYYAPVKDGKSTLILSGLAVGNYTVFSTYGGDDKYYTNIGLANFKVSANDTYEIEVESDPIDFGEDAVVEVTLPEDALGEVTVTVDGETYSVPVINGKATATISDLPSGNHTAAVTYSGDDKYAAVNRTVNIEVMYVFEVSAPDVVKYYNGPERFKVYVFLNDKGLAGETVKITVNGITYERTTDANGTASIALNLNSGTYEVTTEVDDIVINSTVTVKSTVEGSDITKIYRNATQYYATFYDSQGNILTYADVSFNINGVLYNKVTDGKGGAKLNINLNPGEYIITATNPVSGEMYSNVITVLPNIVENHDLVKYYKNASQYVIKVLDDQGRPAAGQNVTFNINGVFYNRTSNATGYVKMNINLEPGTYIITAIYKGLMVSNNIDVLPVLEADDLTMKYMDGSKFKATLVDGQGSPDSGKKITFNINGIFYERITDYMGVASLNINLMPGQYIITSMSENGATISNKVTVSR
ncbi:Ig-like domain repeat protein, partial [Methanobrevibacter sp.]|uniref:Ig-like domain repeat protein n=1 Tax=Methanobrevibacter sp. TaxID=66852 RepID=UPI00388FE563